MTPDEIFKLKASGLIFRAVAYFLLNLNALPSALAARVENKEVELVDGEVIHSFTVNTTDTGIVKVLGNDSVRAIGVSDFDKGKLVEDRAICFDRVELHYAGPSATDISLTGVYTPHEKDVSLDDRYPGPILNAIFRIYVNNKPVLEKQVSQMVNLGREYTGNNVFGEVAIPKIIAPDTAVKMEIELPTDTPAGGTNKHYFKVVLKGAVIKIAPGK